MKMESDEESYDYDEERYQKSCEEYHKQIYFCSNKGLTTLEGLDIPSTALSIYCNNNKLTSLVGLPKGIKFVYCSDNELTNLIGAPKSLLDLTCTGNKLTSLVGLQEGITQLYCQRNMLTSLDHIPSTVQTLSAHSNNFTHFDRFDMLPHIRIFWTFDKITVNLENIPYSLVWLDQIDMRSHKIALYNKWNEKKTKWTNNWLKELIKDIRFGDKLPGEEEWERMKNYRKYEYEEILANRNELMWFHNNSIPKYLMMEIFEDMINFTFYELFHILL